MISAAENAASLRIVRLLGHIATINASTMMAAKSGCWMILSSGTWLKIVHGVSLTP